jgi:hypothetical protein
MKPPKGTFLVGSALFEPTTMGITFPRSILRHAYNPNGNSQLDNNASIDADFLKEVAFGGLNICKETFKVHICLQTFRKYFHHCTSMKFLNNF